MVVNDISRLQKAVCRAAEPKNNVKAEAKGVGHLCLRTQILRVNSMFV